MSGAHSKSHLTGVPHPNPLPEGEGASGGVRRVARWVAFCVLLTALPAFAASLPFTDGFEPPEANFANWSTTKINGTNTLSQSSARAWDDGQSLAFTYAGSSSSAQAAAAVDFAQT